MSGVACYTSLIADSSSLNRKDRTPLRAEKFIGTCTEDAPFHDLRHLVPAHSFCEYLHQSRHLGQAANVRLRDPC